MNANRDDALQATTDDDGAMAFILSGDYRDPSWREMMRVLMGCASPGPFDALSCVHFGLDDERAATVTNHSGLMLADCGPVQDITSFADAIVFAAAVNAVRNLLRDGIAN